MITKPDLIKTLIKNYDELNDFLLNHIDTDYIAETPKIHRLIGRIGAFKECVLGQTEQEHVFGRTTSIKDVNKEIAKELKEGQK